MIEYIDDDQLWRIACDVQDCDQECTDPRYPAGIADDASLFLRRAARFWGFRETRRNGKPFHLCADCGREKDRAERDHRFHQWWETNVAPKIDAARAWRHEAKRLGIG